MISKQQQKYIQSLHIKKYRTENERFLVEGEKNILELLNSDFETEIVYGTVNLLSALKIHDSRIKMEEATAEEIGKVSTLKSNNAGIAVVKAKPNLTLKCGPGETALILDDIRDPGNLGTIIRLADWYGIRKIVCSEETVEFYNPKVIAATMGSFTRVSCFYTSLSDFLAGNTLPVAGTFLEGENVHEFIFAESGYVVIGSESHGISPAVAEKVSGRVTIPRYGGAESLNAAIATAIVLDNFRRVR